MPVFVPSEASGLARITIRAPRRRLDLAIPYHVPLAELLPEVLHRAGEPARDDLPSPQAPGPVGGWLLRRADGAGLTGDAALAQQGVRDGDILYLVPHSVTWPEPEYDDVVEEIAAAARQHGPAWDAVTTRRSCLIAVGLILLTGVALLVTAGPHRTVAGLVAVGAGAVLLAGGALLARAFDDGAAGTVTAGLALPYAAGGGGLLVAGGQAPPLGPGTLLVGACALVLASVVGAVAVGHGRWIFVGGATAGVLGAAGALLAIPLAPAGAAAVLIVALVAGVGAAPGLAVWLGRLPAPTVTAAPDLLAAERRPPRPDLIATVARADEILAGMLLGLSVAVVAGVAVVGAAGGTAGPALGGLAAAGLMLRARLFPSLAARLPLLAAGLASLAVTAWSALDAAGPALRLATGVSALLAVVALLAVAASADRRRPGASPYLGRMADFLDVASMVALVPVACAVLDVYRWVRGLAG